MYIIVYDWYRIFGRAVLINAKLKGRVCDWGPCISCMMRTLWKFTKIYSHAKTISSNCLFSHIFSKNVTFTKFFLKMSESNFSWYLSTLWMFDRPKNKHHTESTDKTFSPRDHFILGSYRATDRNLSFSKLRFSLSLFNWEQF